MKNQPMIAMTLNKNLSNFDCLFLQFDALFGSLDCDYTHN
jgi:hypothetical protein